MNILAKLIYDDVADLNTKIDFSELNDKTVLMTGATGLVGTYMLACLKHINVKVVAIAQSEPDPYYFDLLPEGSKVMKGDLTDEKFLKTLPVADYIIHAAGYATPGKFLSDPIKTLKLNTFATFELFEKLNPAGKFLFISSSEVYSGSDKIPYTEEAIGTTTPTHTRACYIEGKRTGEAISYAYRSRGVMAKVARVSQVYGPGTKKNDRRAHNSFIENALKGEITMLDRGTAKRTYCYIKDGVEMMWNILLFGKDFVYNVGGETKTTVAEFAQKIGSYLGVEVKMPAVSKGLTGSPEDVFMDLSKIKKEFSKNDFVGFEKGLAKTIEWQKILYT